MQIKKFKTLAIMSCLAIMLAGGSAKATLADIDQIIYQNVAGINSSLLSGTVDITVTGTNQLTVVLTNTSPDAAFTDPSTPAAMLLTGFGFQLGPNITGGTVSVAPGTPLNFPGGQSATNISNQWGFSNNFQFNGYGLPGVLPIDAGVSSISSVLGGPPGTLNGLFFGTGNINGPDFGSLSANETQFGSSQPAVLGGITFVLNLDGPAPSVATINAGNVVLAFGSPTAVPDSGSTVALLGFTLIGVEFLRRKISKNRLTLN